MNFLRKIYLEGIWFFGFQSQDIASVCSYLTNGAIDSSFFTTYPKLCEEVINRRINGIGIGIFTILTIWFAILLLVCWPLKLIFKK